MDCQVGILPTTVVLTTAHVIHHFMNWIETTQWPVSPAAALIVPPSLMTLAGETPIKDTWIPHKYASQLSQMNNWCPHLDKLPIAKLPNISSTTVPISAHTNHPAIARFLNPTSITAAISHPLNISTQQPAMYWMETPCCLQCNPWIQTSPTVMEKYTKIWGNVRT